MPINLDSMLPNVVMRRSIQEDLLDQILADFIEEVGSIPHLDYIAFMRDHNGCDGPVGESGYISIWPLEKVIWATEQYGVPEFAPGLLLFGSDGGGEAYAFNRNDEHWPIVQVPLTDLSIDETRLLSQTFTEFIEMLAINRP